MAASTATCSSTSASSGVTTLSRSAELRSFVQFINDPATSDCMLRTYSETSDGNHRNVGTFRLHRVLLAHASPFFRAALAGGMRESSSKQLEWNFPDPCSVFPTLISYIYGGEISLTCDNAVALAVLSHQIQMQELQDQCISHVHNTLGVETSQKYLETALLFNESTPLGLVKLLSEYISENMVFFPNLNLSKLPLQMFIEFISSDALNADEDSVFKLAHKYVENHPELDAEEQAAVWEGVRMQLVSLATLKIAQTIPSIPRNLLIDVLFSLLDKTNEAKLLRKQSRHLLKDSGELPVVIANRTPRLRILELKRFSSLPTAHDWQINGNKHDALSFAVDRDISLWGVGVMGGASPNISIDVSVEITNEVAKTVVLKYSSSYTTTGTPLPVMTLFKKPVLIKRDQQYMIDMLLVGPCTIFSVGGCQSQCRSHGVTFSFTGNQRKSTNGTTPESGQIPSLFFKISPSMSLV
ncbi:BTB/POZ domain-containing protein 3/6 [Pelomyxa schiedti]|nr:BTB/POZ domain-containing protein 3/6 [Pelomyxa schiedti]